MAKKLADFEDSGTAQCGIGDLNAPAKLEDMIAVKPVRVKTSNQENEFRRDCGEPETQTHFEWLAMYAEHAGYKVTIWKHEGQIDDREFQYFDEAMNYFNNWKQ